MRGDCLSSGRVNKAVVVSDDHPALLRARRRKERWSREDMRLYQRHRWRSEGFHGEAKNWRGLARAIRRGLENMRIQAFLIAAAINLKRLAAALATILVTLFALLSAAVVSQSRRCELAQIRASKSPSLRRPLRPTWKAGSSTAPGCTQIDRHARHRVRCDLGTILGEDLGSVACRGDNP